MSLGSNSGDRKRFLTDALERLDQHDGISLQAISSLYETEPWGNTNQSAFYNLAVEIETALAPLELLNTTKLIERQLGREPGPHWGPRAIDIDIVLWETLCLDTSELTIPHPRFHERAFVLVPLSEIAPELCDPATGVPVRELLRQVDGKEGVRRIDSEPLYPIVHT